MQEFGARLAEIGMSKAELGRRLGVSSVQVCRWKSSPPRYALAYLEVVEKLKFLVRELGV